MTVARDYANWSFLPRRSCYFKLKACGSHPRNFLASDLSSVAAIEILPFAGPKTARIQLEKIAGMLRSITIPAASLKQVYARPAYPLRLQSCTAARRTYYSESHPDPSPYPEIQNKILTAAIKRVPQYGFTQEALTLGAKDAGYLEVSVQLFPRGVFDLINYHLVTERLALKDRVQFPDDVKLGVGRKVQTLAMARLRANKDIIHQWQGVSSSKHNPHNAADSDLGTWTYVPIGQYSILLERTQQSLR